jgi:hypothetical protein
LVLWQSRPVSLKVDRSREDQKPALNKALLK